MKDKATLLINFSGFQLGWFACVLSAAKNAPEIGLFTGLMVVVVHVYLAKDRINTLQLLAVVTLLGTVWDSLLTNNQVLVFNSGVMSSYSAPSWIIMMWLLFATTLNVSFRWLYGRYKLAMLMGAIFGPLAYQAGAVMGAVVIPDVMLANVTLGIGWAIIFPLCIKIAVFYQMKSGAGSLRKLVKGNI